MTVTFEVCEVLARVALELDAVLNEEGVVIDHRLEVVHVVRVLDVVAHVVHPACTHVSARAFQLMCTLLHLGPVFCGQSVCDLCHARDQRHHLQPLQHCNEQGSLPAKILNGSDIVDWLGHIKVDYAYK